MKVERCDAVLEELSGLDAGAGPEVQGWICEWGLSLEEEIHKRHVCSTPFYDSALYGSKMPLTVINSSLLGQELNEIIESRFRYGKILIGLLVQDINIYFLMFYIVQLNAKMFKYSWIKAKLL